MKTIEQDILKMYYNYSDQFGLITNEAGEGSGDNGIVYTAQFIILCQMLGLKWDQKDVKKILQQFFDQNGIRQRPDKASDIDYASHDNISAILSLSYIYDLNFHKDFRVLNKKTPHLRDIAYYSALKYPKLQWFFIPIVGLFMISSCCSRYEYNPLRFFQRMKPTIDEHFMQTNISKYNDATSYTYVRMKYIATSTKLLCFIRLRTLNFGIFEKICNHFLRKIFGNLFWNDIFHLYFKDSQHANVEASNKYYAQITGNSESYH